MDNEPLVTIVLPVYNRPHVIKSIESICKQTYKNLEILIVDNASTDNTVEEIKKIDDSRIRLIVNQTNGGQIYSLNRGLELARGKYIARIDSDDIALPTRIEKQVEFLELHCDYVLCGSWVRYVNDEGELKFVVRTCSTSEGLVLMQTISCGIYHPSAMFRRSIIQEYAIKYNNNLAMAADYDLWAKLMVYGKAKNIPEVLIYYRRGDNNDSKKHRVTMGRESSEVRTRICKEINYPQSEKDVLLEIIKLESEKDKSLGKTIRIWRFYKEYLDRHLSRNSVDYPIIKQHILLKVYGSCISENSKTYARLLDKVYHILKNQKR